MRASPRILLVVLLPALVALAVGLPLLWTSLSHVAERSTAEALNSTLGLIESRFKERLAAGDDLQAWSRELIGDEALRLTIIGDDGEVLADSSRTREQIALMDNHGQRPEVLEARNAGRGTAVRQSATLEQDFVYVARGILREDGSRVVLRLSRPMSALAGVRQRLAGLLWAVLLVSLLTIGVVAGWLNARLFRPLAQLADGAARIAKGELEHRLDPSDEEALERVGASLNQLGSRVAEQVAAVESERTHLEVVGASMSEGILVTDRVGRFVLANPSSRKLFRLKGEVAGLSATELPLPSEIEDMIRGTIETGEKRSAELELTSPHRRWVAVTSSLLSDATGVVVAARDITDLVRQGEARRDLVANVSHELKTPLTAIRGYAETLRDGALEDREARARFVDRILQQCLRLQALLDDLLKLSRLESTRGAVEFEAVALAEVVREAIEVLGPGAERAEVTLSTEVADDLIVEGNRPALEELFLNLVDNAIKYNRTGGQVEIRARQSESLAVLVVEDSGRGIPPGAIPRLFERFYRVDRGRARGEGGTGLGLAIVKHAVMIHGGEIGVESEVGRGSSFRIELPVSRADPRLGASRQDAQPGR